jgi:hypothetical protein
MAEAEDSFHPRTRTRSQTEILRDRNPNVGLPRQKVNEAPIRNILDDIDTKIFAERQQDAAKESRLKKAMALELVDAGFRGSKGVVGLNVFRKRLFPCVKGVVDV